MAAHLGQAVDVRRADNIRAVRPHASVPNPLARLYLYVSRQGCIPPMKRSKSGVKYIIWGHAKGPNGMGSRRGATARALDHTTTASVGPQLPPKSWGSYHRVSSVRVRRPAACLVWVVYLFPVRAANPNLNIFRIRNLVSALGKQPNLFFM